MIGLMKKIQPDDDETTTYSDSSGKHYTVSGNGPGVVQEMGFKEGGQTPPADNSDIRKYHQGGVVGRSSDYRKVYLSRKSKRG
jgi:hypothetical protein